MRIFITIAILIANSSVLLGQQISDENDPKRHPRLTNKTFVDQIKGRPINFYLSHKGIDSPAKMFYIGEFALSDDAVTFGFLDSLLTTNAETGPFYLFIFNQALKISDGALSEYMDVVCRRYLEKLPCEFLTNLYADGSQMDIGTWASFIGFDLYDRKTFEAFVEDVDKEININCSSLRPGWNQLKLRIEGNLEEK